MNLTPLERERKFMAKLNIGLIQRALWPLLVAFILLNFSDVMTTLFAAESFPGFVEFNSLGADLFKLGFTGFMLAYLLKFVPAVPLIYMVGLHREDPEDDFQVRLLKFAALIVLVSTDIYLGAIVFGNNLPLLIKAMII